jgi:hypothetical protein
VLYNLLILAERFAQEASLYCTKHNRDYCIANAKAALDCFDAIAYEKENLEGFDMVAFDIMKYSLLSTTPPKQEVRLIKWQLMCMAVEAFENQFNINQSTIKQK